MVRHAGDRLQMAYHMHPGKGSKVFLRTPISSSKPRHQRLQDVLSMTNETFGIRIIKEDIVPALSFIDILKDENTYSEHYIAILDEGFEVKSNHTFKSTAWVDIDRMFSVQWPWYRTLFIQQICTVLKVIQDHYNILKRRTPSDFELAPHIASAQRTCLIARQIVIAADRTDLLYGVTVRGLRSGYETEEENHIPAIDTDKSETVEKVFGIVTQHQQCQNAIAELDVTNWDEWFRMCDNLLGGYDSAYYEVFGSNAHEYTTSAYRAIGCRLAQQLGKNYGADERQG